MWVNSYDSAITTLYWELATDEAAEEGDALKVKGRASMDRGTLRTHFTCLKKCETLEHTM